jgi:hypothetical protein
MLRFSLSLVLLGACSPAPSPSEPPPPEAPVHEPEPQGGPMPPLPTETMVQQMIGELVLDHPRVAAHLHAAPVSIWPIPELALGAPSMRARGRPVLVAERESDATFRFRAYETLGNRARVRVRFEIPSEGVSGHVDVELRDNVWEVVDAAVVER